MIIRWLLIASFLLLIACYAHQHTAAHPIRFPEFREGRTVVKSAQNKIQPTLALENGMLKIQTPAGAAISGIKLRLSFRDGSSLTGSLQPAGQEMAEDKAGSYERFWYRLSANSPRRADANTPDVKLEVRHYKKSGVVVALMD